MMLRAPLFLATMAFVLVNASDAALARPAPSPVLRTTSIVDIATLNAGQRLHLPDTTAAATRSATGFPEGYRSG